VIRVEAESATGLPQLHLEITDVVVVCGWRIHSHFAVPVRVGDMGTERRD